jgi:hypothetical protein
MKGARWDHWVHGIMLALGFGLIFTFSRACRTETDYEYRCHCSNCMTYQEMFALQEEAKTNLQAIWTAEITYFSNANTYATTFAQIGWNPDPHRNYAYFLAADVIQPDLAGPYVLPAGLDSQVTYWSFTAYAVGNLDCDPVVDVWMVNDARALKTVVNDALE